METKITENYFEFENLKYFRGNAHLVQPGTFGRKKDPIGPKAYIDPYGHVRPEYLIDRVNSGPTIAVDWNQTTKAALEINGLLKYFGLNGKIETNVSYEKAKTANLRLANFFINEGPLKTMLNTDADAARCYLADEGHDGRIVAEGWVWMEGELAEHFSTYASTSLTVSKGEGESVKLSVTGGKYGSQSISISPGTVFAFKLYKVKDWNKGKTQIDALTTDYHGIQ
jgi:hypothetical protein